jgi:hypothetical protein
MARKKQPVQNVQVIPKEKHLSLDDLDVLSQEIDIRRHLELEKAYSSSDPHSIMRAAQYVDSKKGPQDTIKSYLFDPNVASLNTNNYRTPIKNVSYQTLKRMARTPIIRTIIGTRVDQVAGFAEAVDSDSERGWKIRKRRTLFDENAVLTDQEKRDISQITEFILEGGTTDNKWNFESFEEYLRQITNDSLTIDQICLENVYSRGGKLVQFYPVDGATIRLIDDSDLQRLSQYTSPKRGYWPKYCQIWQEQVTAFYYPWEMTFGVRNKTTDVMSNGYGVSELEDMVNLVTWTLFGLDYNGKFFCISGDSKILTNFGVKHIESLVGRSFQTFDGVKWNDSTAYQTDVLDLYVTTLKNGLQTKTSSKHKFLVCTDAGQIEWKEQQELISTDCALISSTSLNKTNLSDFFIGKEYRRTFTNPTGEITCEKPNKFVPTKELVEDREFWEIIGFALGDGHWGKNLLQIFPHFEKDKIVFEKARMVFEKYGINYREVVINKKFQRKTDGEFGYPSIFVYHTTFLDWLYELGFKKSGNKKVPLCLYNLSDELRGAFLRGWFSADGHTQVNKLGYSTPSICCVDDKLRQDCLQLLISLGVWSTMMKVGKSSGYRNIDYFQIRVQDIEAFVEKVGYLQEYKNKNICRSYKSKNKWDLVPNAFALPLIEGISTTMDCMVPVVKNGGKISRKKLISILQKAGRSIPNILNYHFVSVFDVGKISIGKQQLYDIEVFNDAHIFLSDYIAVHNSQGSNPKGFFSIEGNVPPNALNDFKQMWRNTVSGNQNAWKVPVLETGGNKVSWNDMQKTNLEMEFKKWIDFLTTISCCMFKIDPSECGFNLEGNNRIFGQDGQKQRLQHSQTKGLTPILKLIQRLITKYIVSQINDRYEFVFCGVETEDQLISLDMDVKKSQNGFMSLEDLFKKYSDRDFDPNKDTLLNQVWLQMKQQQQMGGDGMNGLVDGMEQGQEEELQENPFEKALISYLERPQEIVGNGEID